MYGVVEQTDGEQPRQMLLVDFPFVEADLVMSCARKITCVNLASVRAVSPVEGLGRNRPAADGAADRP